MGVAGFPSQLHPLTIAVTIIPPTKALYFGVIPVTSTVAALWSHLLPQTMIIDNHAEFVNFQLSLITNR